MTLFHLRMHKSCLGNPRKNPTRINMHNIVAVNKMLIQADGVKNCCSFLSKYDNLPLGWLKKELAVGRMLEEGGKLIEPIITFWPRVWCLAEVGKNNPPLLAYHRMCWTCRQLMHRSDMSTTLCSRGNLYNVYAKYCIQKLFTELLIQQKCEIW